MIDFFHGLWQFELEAHPPKPRFAPDDIPDLSGKIAIVTGANSGVGKEVAKVRACASLMSGYHVQLIAF